jgi:hypothetical protein
MASVAARLAGAVAALVAAAVPAGAVVGVSTTGAAPDKSLVMVLNHRGTSAGFCTGIVLSSHVVLTAAHCMPPGADLRIDIPGTSPAPTLLAVDAVMRHPGYRPDAIRQRERSIDLALVRVVSPLPDGFEPARLAANAGTEPGQAYRLTGFGVGVEGEAHTSGQSRSVTLVARQPLSSVLLWATDPAHRGAGACTGDSGAPMVAEDGAVAALVVWSAGAGSRQCGDLTQALWLAPHRAWIDSVVAAWRSRR